VIKVHKTNTERIARNMIILQLCCLVHIGISRTMPW